MLEVLTEKIFTEGDVNAAEFMIASIINTLESGENLSEDQRRYLTIALKSLIADPERPKSALGILRKDKRGNFKGMEFWEEYRDHLIYLHELKYRFRGQKGRELHESIRAALSSRFTVTDEAINRAKKRVKDEYTDTQLSLESIDLKIKSVLEALD